MRKWNRLGFLAASAAALTSLTGTLLVGCGSGTDKDTTFKGTYSGDFLVNREAQVIDPADSIAVVLEPSLSGNLTLTIDIKGNTLGNLITVSGKNYAFSGDTDEEGHFQGTLKTTDGEKFSLSGTLTEQNVSPLGTAIITDLAVINRVNQTPADDTVQFFAGLGGSFNISIDGVKHTGNLAIVGGQTTTTN